MCLKTISHDSTSGVYVFLRVEGRIKKNMISMIFSNLAWLVAVWKAIVNISNSSNVGIKYQAVCWVKPRKVIYITRSLKGCFILEPILCYIIF